MSACGEAFGKMIWIEECSEIQISFLIQARAACSLSKAVSKETKRKKKRKAIRRVRVQFTFPRATS